MQENIQKLITISLVGAPNAGKSTLINLIVGDKVSAISPKCHTTRQQMLGVKTIDNVQMIFLDNPGFMSNNSKIDLESDYICIVLDATHPWQYSIKRHITELIQAKADFLIIINKGDLISKERWIELIDSIKLLGYQEAIWFISALYNKGVDKVLNFLHTQAQPRTWWFDENTKHTQSRKQMVLECVREKVFHLTHKEIPYGIELRMEEFTFGRKWKAFVIVKTERKGQKSILIGKNASVIKSIGESARLELCTKFGPGSLFLKIM